MFSVGTLHDRVAEPAAGLAGADGDEGVVGDVGTEVPLVVEVDGDVPTPLPQPVRSRPIIARAQTALRDLIATMAGLKYGYMVLANCRRLGT